MKWFGQIAFREQEEDPEYTWKTKIILRDYYGDLLRTSKRDQLSSETVNSDITLTNTLSVVADPFLLDSFSEIEYVTCMGSKWRVSSVDVNYPRLTLSFGSLYKEESKE